MTWTRLDDDHFDRPDVMRAGRSARLLHQEALVWCNRLLTDGVLPSHMLSRITDAEDPESDAAELEAAGLWTRTDEKTWQVEWSSQEDATTVRRRRATNAERQRRYNDRRERHARGDHTACDPRFCSKSPNASSNGTGNPPDGGLPSRPVPSRPDPKGGTGTGTKGDDCASSGSSLALAASSASPSPHRGESKSEPDLGPSTPLHGMLPTEVTPTVNRKPIQPMTAEEADRWSA